jgi:RNA polymerase sigma-70 factor (ECF subfamily)
VTRDAHSAATRAVREHYSRVLAALAAQFRDVAAAEDALSESLVAALQQWPASGVPDNPAAWLLTVARRRLIDHRRRQSLDDAARERIAQDFDAISEEPEMEDKRLHLLFACAHPAIEEKVRAPLMLQVVLGLEASEIAALFLMPPAAMAQRLVRAKQKIRDAAIPFRIPSPEDYPERLGFVLMAIYALFCVGYNATVVPNGPRDDRDSPSFDALWLGQLVVALSDRDPEALGLLSLMLFVESRRDARRDAQGRYIPLSEQTPSLWDFEAIRRANALLKEAANKVAPGRFQIEAAVQSVHAARAQSGETDWASILTFYDALLASTPTPVVLINRALAISHVQGIDAALEETRSLDDDPRIAGYQPYWAARAHLLAKAGRNDEAERAYARAIALESDPAVREFLQTERSRLSN